MPNEAYGRGIYQSVLVLSRHLRFELGKGDLGFGSRRELRWIAKKEEQVLTDSI
jgi:hypothetical protein